MAQNAREKLLMELSQKMKRYIQEQAQIHAQSTALKNMYENFAPFMEDTNFVIMFVERFLLEYWEEDSETGEHTFNKKRLIEDQDKSRQELIKQGIINAKEEGELEDLEKELKIPEEVEDKISKYFAALCDVYTCPQ